MDENRPPDKTLFLDDDNHYHQVAVERDENATTKKSRKRKRRKRVKMHQQDGKKICIDFFKFSRDF